MDKLLTFPTLILGTAGLNPTDVWCLLSLILQIPSILFFHGLDITETLLIKKDKNTTVKACTAYMRKKLILERRKLHHYIRPFLYNILSTFLYSLVNVIFQSFYPHFRLNILSLRFGHENISATILSLPLIQEGQLSVTCKRMGTTYWFNCLGGLPRNSVAKLTDRARNYLKCVEGP